jgi:hypothetical protein
MSRIGEQHRMDLQQLALSQLARIVATCKATGLSDSEIEATTRHALTVTGQNQRRRKVKGVPDAA